MKIFVSSTVNDLKAERKKAIETIERDGEAVAMEKFFAADHQSKDVCIRRLQWSDAVVLIIGGQYGTIIGSDDISITEIEYNTARSLGLPVLCFLKVDENRRWASEETDPARKAKHEAFKLRVEGSCFRKTFSTSDELGTEIVGAIHEYQKTHGKLGVRLPSFVPPEEFFHAWLDASRLLHHCLGLVGRGATLEQLHQFIGQEARVATLYGRGGTGKSRLLLEVTRQVASQHPGWSVYFLRDGAQLTEESFKELPANPCLVVVDDAHRVPDLHNLLAFAERFPQRIKLLLSSRPQGREAIVAMLSRARLELWEVRDLGELNEMGSPERIELARQALEGGRQDLARLLANATKDCPLVTVVAARLLVRNQINPALLERQQEFQYEVLERFREEALGRVSQGADPQLRRSVLQVIAAVGPIRPTDRKFQDAATSFLKCQVFELIEAIAAFESAGILVRRGYTLRIAPDVLSDHVLHSACVSPQGQATGYAEAVFAAFADVSQENVLANLAELDWRIRQGGSSVDLLGSIWNGIDSRVRDASHYERIEITSMLEKAAFFQPRRVLELVEYIMQHAASKSGREDTLWAAAEQWYTHERVLEQLPELLKAVAWNPEYLPRCCDLLWHLGRDDKRNANPHPEHAIRVLQDLGGYRLWKSVNFTIEVSKAVARWLKEPNAHRHAHSPFEVLDPILRKEGEDSYSEGPTMYFRSFPVSPEKTKPARDLALELLEAALISEDVRVVLRALQSLVGAMNIPHGTYGRAPSDEEIAQWHPEQRRILAIIEKLARTSQNPIVLTSLRLELHWYAHRASNEEIKQTATRIIASIPDSFDVRLVKALRSGQDRVWGEEDYEVYGKRLEDEIRASAQEFMEQNPLAESGFTRLDSELRRLEAAGISTQAGYFLHQLAVRDPRYGGDVYRQAIEHRDSPVGWYADALLSPIRAVDRKLAASLIKAGIETAANRVCYGIARGYRWWNWHRDLDDQDIKTIETLLSHPDREVVALAIQALSEFKGEWERKAIDLLLSVKIGQDEKLAESVCEAFQPGHGIPLDRLSETDVRGLLARLIEIKEIDDNLYHVDQFLGYVSQKNPSAVVDLFLERLQRVKRYERSSEFQPMPYLGFRHTFSNLSSHPEYLKILRRVRDSALEEMDVLSFWLPKLFSDLSGGVDAQAVGVLREWIASGDARRLEVVGLLLREAGANFVFREESFVCDLLNAAKSVSEECRQRVASSLFGSAISGTRSGTPGMPMPQDVELRDTAQTVMARQQAGSMAYEFYAQLKAHAEESIRDSLARDEEIFA